VPLADGTVDADGVVALLSSPPDGVIALSGGYLAPALQPERALATAAARATRRPGAWGRPPLSGVRGLREWFARTAGGDVTAADVTITSGGQAAVTLVLRALLPPGAPLLVESPTYLGALASARAAGLRPVPVPVDDDGLRTTLLADAFAATGARALYCQPTFHNPTGAVLSPGRREQVLDVARAAGAFVIEDDFARQLAARFRRPLWSWSTPPPGRGTCEPSVRRCGGGATPSSPHSPPTVWPLPCCRAGASTCGSACRPAPTTSRSPRPPCERASW
jgi:DNA-binding transcriptional MocR family regulator